MKDQIQESRRSFLKATSAGAAGIMLGGASIKNASASSGGAWTDGMQLNPAIDNLRVVCAHDESLPNQNIEADMDKMAMALAQKSTASAAWATIFRKPANKAWADVQVAMKAGMNLRCVKKLFDELNKLGVPYANMVYFDSNTGSLNFAGDISGTVPGVRWSAHANGPNDRLHGLTPTPVPYKGTMVNMNCATDIANGFIDILISAMYDHGHGDAFAGASLTCKNLYGVFNGLDSINFLHGYIGQNPDGITGMLSLQKSSAIIGGNPPRQQLAFLDCLGSKRMVMGTFAPMVDYLAITKIRGPIGGNTYNAAVAKRYYQDFGYTDAQVANIDFIDALSCGPTGTIYRPRSEENIRIQFAVSSPSFKSSAIDIEVPFSECIPMSISIFDQRGRLVRELAPKKEQGMMVAWDGNAQSGIRVPAGMYAVKVINGNSISTGSLMLVSR